MWWAVSKWNYAQEQVSLFLNEAGPTSGFVKRQINFGVYMWKQCSKSVWVIYYFCQLSKKVINC